MLAGYAETQVRWQDLAFTFGLRADQFNAHRPASAGQPASGSNLSLSPRFAVSTVLRGATVVVSYGRFSQAPDFQYLVDAAFDDTTRTGRFRAGNPSLGYENSNQYEFSVRGRPRPGISIRVNAYVKRLEGLVASVPLGINPDSTIFGNIDTAACGAPKSCSSGSTRTAGARASWARCSRPRRPPPTPTSC